MGHQLHNYMDFQLRNNILNMENLSIYKLYFGY